ncbi:MAG: chromosome segregation protein SMC [Thermoguttaceae bacterium]|nr:chromosome segregation protein SMC [Thermoguttaceae bacterium]
MLTSIEIAGFKSFADKARIDFSEGISVIVGPNGSGKSNIVDAIKWVLGEQSVKKLRGTETTDVIFGGSKTRDRANMAEVTLTFDNRSRFFPLDSDDIHITRRLYRNGDSDYLINRQGTRLRDIRELLSGSGLGAHAYSIIEQGRVGLLLQSTSAQRRAILEDAAGTSLFNARSQEAIRRMERVEQNILRLGDIVNELENQYKRTKSQAGKALQYREYERQLQILRTEAALVEWRRNKARIEQIDSQSERLDERRVDLESSVQGSELIRKKYVGRLSQVEKDLRDVDAELGDVREKAAAGQSTVSLQMDQIGQLDSEIFDQGLKLDEIKLQNSDAEESIQQIAEEILQARRHYREVKSDYDTQHEELSRLSAECDDFRSRLEQDRALLEDEKVRRSRLAGEISGLEARLSSVQQRSEEKEARYRKLSEILSDFVESDSRLKGELQRFDDNLSELNKQVSKKKTARSDAVSQLEQLNTETRETEQQLALISERLSITTNLVKNQEGLSPGVKEVLRRSADPNGPFRNVHGLVADLIRVSAEAAPLIESALGQKAQYVVVSPDEKLFAFIEKNIRDESVFPGRVGFMWLDAPAKIPNQQWKESGVYDNLPGVLGRADRFVETDPKFEYLIYRLLGQTWIVENFKTAKKLYGRSDGQTNFFTITGEAILSNGTLLVGSSQATDGQIMRRTEIRTLSEEKVLLENNLLAKQAQIAEISKQIARYDLEIATDEKKTKDLQNEADSLRLKQTAQHQQDKISQSEYLRIKKELEDLSSENEQIISELENNRGSKLEIDQRTADLERSTNELHSSYTRSDEFRKDAQKKVNDLGIELAKSEERLNSFSSRQLQLNESLSERKKLLTDHARQLDTLRTRRESAEFTVLCAESVVAEQYWQKEKLMGKRDVLIAKKESASALVRDIDARLEKDRKLLSKVRENLRLNEIERERLSDGMKSQVDTMREDYGIDLPARAAEVPLPPADDVELHGKEESFSSETSVGTLEECTKEIESLKRKINRLGSVNHQALETLEVLETRYKTSSNQYKDLLAARHGIQNIIGKTNKYRQEVFDKTFEAVKIHFQNIFQQLFGGGHADIVFDDPDNKIESGISIIARPPGKELKNVELLSGGEKTLTSVAFLLALFLHRSSPICILDEVDAALDEVNVDRFNAVLRDFETDTQFIMITHSKKTMMVAKSLYGVTMQDSGVSKLIAVQFDEVGEDGEILVKDSNRRAAA